MSTPSNRTAGALLLDIATTIGIVTALIYAAGYTYANHYFGHFSVGLLTLAIPKEYFFMYGFWVLKDWWWALLLAYIVFVLCNIGYPIWISPRLSRWQTQHLLLLKHLQVLAALLAFVVAWWLAALSAEQYYDSQQERRFIDYPHIQVWLKTSPKNTDLQKLYDSLAEGSYRLLLQNQSKLFLFKPPRDAQPARLAVIEVATSDVQSLRVLP